MRALHLGLPVLGLIITAHVRAASVLSVTITTLPVVVGENETIVVAISAPCSAVQIDFGDGITQTYPATPPQLTVYYAWTTSGNKTVTAKGVNDCTGQASTVINVQTSGSSGGSPLGDLCKVVDCGELADMFGPKITGILAVHKPGGVGWIKGKNLGSSPGTAAVSLARFDGTPQNEPLEIINWTPTLVQIKYPEGISGVMDQDATVQITTSAQATSNAWPVLFRAAETTSFLQYEEVTDINCGTDSNLDICGQEYDEDDESWFGGSPFRGPCSGTICGSHENAWAAIGDDSDKDVFELPTLKNDWVYSGSEKLTWNTSGGSLSGPTGLVPNTSTGPVLTMKWTVTPNDDVEYDVAIRIRGPVGVPRK